MARHRGMKRRCRHCSKLGWCYRVDPNPEHGYCGAECAKASLRLLEKLGYRWNGQRWEKGTSDG